MATSSRRRSSKPPKYSLHKATGQARVLIRGVSHYLGNFNSPESLQRYAALIAELSAGAVVTSEESTKPASADGVSIAELVLGYLRFAQGYYVKNGRVTDEVDCIKSAVRPLVKLYSETPAAEFGPLKLKAVRQAMVDSGKLCRRYINFSVSRIRRMFRWAVENELVRPEVLVGLKAVTPLLKGRTEAKHYAPRSSVPVVGL